MIPDGTPNGGHLTRVYRPSDRPGSRFPHLWLDMARKRSTLDWFDKDFAVVAGPQGEAWLEAGRDVSAKTGLPLNLRQLPRSSIPPTAFRWGRAARCWFAPMGTWRGACRTYPRIPPANWPARSKQCCTRRHGQVTQPTTPRSPSNAAATDALVAAARRRSRSFDVRCLRGAARAAFHRDRLRPARFRGDPQSAVALWSRRAGGRCRRADRGARLSARPCIRDVARRRHCPAIGRAPPRADRSSGVVQHIPPRAGFARDQSGGISENRGAPQPSAGVGGRTCQYLYTPDYLAAHPQVASRFAGTTRNEEQKQRRAAILTRPVEFELSAISSPTLVLAGNEDRLIPKAHTLALAREIAGAKTAIIAGVGHVGTIQDPAAVAVEVRAFLQNDQA